MRSRTQSRAVSATATLLAGLALAVTTGGVAHADQINPVNPSDQTQLAYASKTPCGGGYQEVDVYSSQYGYLLYVCYR